MPEQTIGDLGEFGLIARISGGAGNSTGAVVLGIGDDTAALRVTPGRLLLATCDVQVERVHFLRDAAGPREIGHKSLAVNISDIASMGGIPRFALISLGLPTDTPVSFVDGLYEGIYALAREHSVDVVGGNMSGSPTAIFIDITVLGEIEPEAILRRDGARPGQHVIVTGHPGDSAGGLAVLLSRDLRCPSGSAERLLAAHRTPSPRVAAGRAIAGTGAASAMIDISDGLAADLGHIAEASGVGAELWADALPVSDDLRALATAAGRDPLGYALFGGEDYELIAIVRPESEARVLDAIRETGLNATVIGETTTPDRGLTLRHADGTTRPLTAGGYKHF
jgi:thiamine-monophosphate kinase